MMGLYIRRWIYIDNKHVKYITFGDSVWYLLAIMCLSNISLYLIHISLWLTVIDTAVGLIHKIVIFTSVSK